MIQKAKVLVTGSAGFIGFHLCKALCEYDLEVVGLDNLNDYYDVNLKKSRINALSSAENFEFIKLDLANKDEISRLFEDSNFDYVVNLAAQAGVRYSLEKPSAYIDSNINGFLNILEGCRHTNVKHLVYASSSSVYGGNTQMPFSVHHNVDHPVSLYAVSKKSNELMAHSYSHLFELPTTGLRFFTVYGPYGRPDMALFLFTKAILEGKPIDVYNNGKMRRDFTYIDDIVSGITKILPNIPTKNSDWDFENPDPGSSWAPYKIYNIGNNNPVDLMDFVKAIESALNKKAIINYMPLQAGDVPASHADVNDLIKDVDFKPSTPIKVGIERFVSWYLKYYDRI